MPDDAEAADDAVEAAAEEPVRPGTRRLHRPARRAWPRTRRPPATGPPPRPSAPSGVRPCPRTW
nr:hypothetical protein [Angustibacter aerolatus]